MNVHLPPHLVTPEREKPWAALFDWDGTLRPGFLAVEWVWFLLSHSLFDPRCAREIMNAVDGYRAGDLRYLEFAHLVVGKYAAGLEGVAVDSTKKAAVAFASQDTQVPEFTFRLLRELRDRRIAIIVISGSPELVLMEYRRMLPVTNVHGTQVPQNGGRWTAGDVTNAALPDEKRRAIARLAETHRFLLAMGDTVSDEPLLEAAPLRFVMRMRADGPPDKRTGVLAAAQEVRPATVVGDIVGAADSWLNA